MSAFCLPHQIHSVIHGKDHFFTDFFYLFVMEPRMDDGLHQFVFCGTVQFPQTMFHYGPQVFNGIQIGRISWPVQNFIFIFLKQFAMILAL